VLNCWQEQYALQVYRSGLVNKFTCKVRKRVNCWMSYPSEIALWVSALETQFRSLLLTGNERDRIETFNKMRRMVLIRSQLLLFRNLTSHKITTLQNEIKTKAPSDEWLPAIPRLSARFPIQTTLLFFRKSV